MSDHNPSDSFDSHPENSGCSNDEQLDVPGIGYPDNGDADGPDDDGFGAGSDDAYGFNYDQGAEVSTTTGIAGEEDEAEADQYPSGASEAEAYGYTADSLLVDEDGDFYDERQDPPVQPSAPDSDPAFPVIETDHLHATNPGPDILEPAMAYASSAAADILSTITQSASPPSGHYREYEPEPISSTVYDDNDDDVGYDEEREHEQQTSETEHEQQAFEHDLEQTPEKEHFVVFPDEPTKAPREPTPELDKFIPELVEYAEPIVCTSSTDIKAEKITSPPTTSSEGTAGGCLLKNLDPREESNEEADVAIQPTFFKDLIYWRDVKKSGIVFGSLLVLLVSLAFVSIISVLANLSLVVLTGTFSFVIYKKVSGAVRKSGDGHPFSCLLNKEINLNENKLKHVIQTVLKNFNATVKELRHLFLVEDAVDSIKFGVLLWALTYIGSWFSDLALVIIVLVLAFTVPKLYETYQVQIDNYVGLAKAQINSYLSIIQNKIPFLKKKEKAH